MMRFRIFACLATTLLALGIVPEMAAQITGSAITETHDSTWNQSTRVQQKRVEANGRTTETQVVETPSINGGYRLQSATEKETIREGPDTIREVERWYAPDADGRPRLSRIVETRTTTVSGEETTTRVRYDADLDGHMQVGERQVQNSVSLSALTKEATSTLFLPRGGVIVPVQQTVTLETTKQGGLTDVQRSVSFPDQNGQFVKAQVTESVEQSGDRNSRRTEQRISEVDTGKVPGEGQMSPIQRTEKQEWKDADGQEHGQANTYSMFTTGIASDGQLHLDRQVETVRTIMPDGTTRTIEETVEINPGARTDGPRLKSRRIEISHQDPGKQFAKQTIIEIPNSSGTMQSICISSTRGFETRKAVPPEHAGSAAYNSCQ